MGVEKFFSSLKKGFTNMPKFINEFTKSIQCKHFLIDFNSIVHVISQNLLKHNKINYTKKEFEIIVIKHIGIYIEELLKTYLVSNKLKTLYICIDGVPTMAKIYEQKKRRYMGDLLSYLTSKNNVSIFTWSKNNISPGTDFMMDMIIFLKSKEFENKIKAICPNLEKYIVSGVDVDGEGEYKIIKIIEHIPINDSICVYSPDSDMIILLFLVNRSCIMLRYDQQSSTISKPVYNVIEIDKFKHVFLEYIKIKLRLLNNFHMKEKNIINDMVFILSVFGDDFLPKLETVRVTTDINILIDFYILNTYRHGYLLMKENNNWCVNTLSFLNYLKLIQKKEDYFIERNAKYHVIKNYYKLEKAILGDMLYKIREYAIYYIWKFIYYNKPKNITVTPINVFTYIDINIFIDYINKPEQSIDNKILSGFIKQNVNGMVCNDCIKMMECILASNYIILLQNIDAVLLHKYKNYFDKITKSTYYIENNVKEMLIQILIYFYITYELPFNITIKSFSDKMYYNNFDSTKPPHKNTLANLTDYDKETYLLDQKLDHYYNIFNPKDKFYYIVYKQMEITPGLKIEIDYKRYYEEHFDNTSVVDIVTDYISGLNWIVNYYHNHIVDRTWYYRHNRSPMLHSIIKYYDSKLFKITNNVDGLLTPLEHFLFVSPFHVENVIKVGEFHMIEKYNGDKINNIINFINNNKKYYYPLNTIYTNLTNKKYIDCSSSHFISKCNILFMENYININNFIKDIRQII